MFQFIVAIMTIITITIIAELGLNPGHHACKALPLEPLPRPLSLSLSLFPFLSLPPSYFLSVVKLGFELYHLSYGPAPLCFLVIFR
jgi:hypothetical protein